MHGILSILLSAISAVLIPVQFKDSEADYSSDYLTRLSGITSDYFLHQSGGKSQFDIRISQPVTLGSNLSYYGSNSVSTRDEMFPRGVVEACNLAGSAGADFGGADLVMILAAGPAEEDGSGDSFIWSHYSTLPANLQKEISQPYRVGKYLVVSGLTGNPEKDAAKLCHETGHYLGLPDLYDTDRARSGGQCDPGLTGLALMYSYSPNITAGRIPPISAISRHLTGFGSGSELSRGSYLLSEDKGDYLILKNPTDPSEYYLIEAVGRSLVGYHVDRSDNPAGWSDREKKKLKASERWALNEVNCNPEHPCASALLASGPSMNFEFYWGDPAPISICNIRNTDEGISFDAVEAFVMKETEVFQDGAAIRFGCNIPQESLVSLRVDWISEGKTVYSAQAEKIADSYYAMADKHFSPSSSGSFRIVATDAAGNTYICGRNFTTAYLRRGSFPYIRFSRNGRGEDGSFSTGTVIPLKVFNCEDVSGIDWYWNGRRLTSNWLMIESGGELKAVITRSDSSREILVKQITAR